VVLINRGSIPAAVPLSHGTRTITNALVQEPSQAVPVLVCGTINRRDCREECGPRGATECEGCGLFCERCKCSSPSTACISPGGSCNSRADCCNNTDCDYSNGHKVCFP
jgi:hypothetical protein